MISQARTHNTYLQKFIELYGGQPEEVRLFFAPGRVNVIGEHTDYNGGFVFPAALTYGIWAFVRPRKDETFNFASLNFEQRVTCRASNIAYHQEDDWANYPKGVISELLKDGCSFSGVDMLFYGNLPNSAGLSSSAAIEVVTALAMNTIYDLKYNNIDLAQLSQRAENHFVGVNCGIMDQFAVAMGAKDRAIFLDCRTLEYEHVPLALDGYKLVVSNTNKKRGLGDSKYNERRQECEDGLKILQQQLPGKKHLGEIGIQEWKNVKHVIHDATIANRVAHVIHENERVKQAKQVLQSHLIPSFGELMYQSHESLRDLYEVTGAELDSLYRAARQVPGCVGTRMTGAGFGGCTVSLVAEDAIDEFRETVTIVYNQEIGYSPSIYAFDIGDGAREITKEVVQWPS
ncbi:galactokinase [Caldalkalibacillus salinus]|uniref:galactokinase n=1 Tax=Caldalkalibacillus salinus TaxID=2803787 RepID=UPI001924E97B|nr:galactokinase [Caldalkalibacillus salinus]